MKSLTPFRRALRASLLLLSLAIVGTAVGDEPRDLKKGTERKAKASKERSSPKEAAFQLTNANVVKRQEAYKTIGDVTLKIDIFEPKQKDPAKKYPAVVFFFGGGWNGGSPSQFYHHCEYFAGRGMIAMAADYRVNGRNKTTPAECVMDGKSAVRWIRANAARLGVDPARIAAGGGSAGGHVAAAVATSKGFEQADEDASVSFLPNALVLFNPVYDNGPKGYGHERVKDFFPAISPFHNLRPGTPPTIVFLGTRDNLIPVATAQEYQAQMKKNGDRSDLFLYEDQPHGFFNFREGSTRFYYQTVFESDKFFASLGWIEGEPKIAPESMK
jgi:acetyl esterase/lipase